MDTFTKHQKAIAKKTLGMSVSGARIMGGMNHAQAYRIIFNHDLTERLKHLIKAYPSATDEHWASTELDIYGWSNTEDWIELLEACEND